MSVIFLLIAVSIMIAGCFLAAFIWSVKHGQFDDDYTPSTRILFEDKTTKKSTTNHNNQKPTQHANGEVLL